MFKNIFYKATVLTVIAISACSCNKFLELRPQNGITSDQFWLTKEQLSAAVTGIYDGLLTGSGAKSPAEVFFLWGEIRADMIAPGVKIAADEQSIINTAILPTNSIVNWQPMYYIINLCNTVLQFGPGVITKDATLTQTQLNSYLGEALAIRSLMYFYLVRSYRDVPFLLTAVATDGDLAQLPKTDSKTILTQIVADLKTAEGYLPASYSDNATDKGRVNKFTVNAIQADVYLWMDDYANTIVACNKVMNSGKYALVPGPTPGGASAGNWFNTLYANGNSIEGIFELQFDIQQLNPYYAMFSPSNVTYRFKPEPNLLDDFYTEDPAGVFYDIRGIDVAIHVADQSIYKWVTGSLGNLLAPANSYRHWIMYRYADILLMKAEAEINDGVDGADALALINQVRTRANALVSSSQSPSNSDVNGMTTYLVAERSREFAFEGKRWYDLLRNAKRNNFARLDLLQTAALLSVPPLYQQSAISKLGDPNYLYFPVPTYDIQHDPNLVQNPFYK